MNFSAHNVVSFFQARNRARDWDNAELAQFFRVESALRQAGIFVDTDRGVTDEGDPWFVYCRQDSGDVFLHVARFDGFYVAVSPSMATPLWRRKFSELLDELVRDNPVVLSPQPRRPSTDLYIHPSTLLIAAVAALFYKNAPIRSDDHGDNPLRQETRAAQGTSMLSEVYSAALVSAIAIIAVLHHTHADDAVVDEQHAEELAFLDGILFNRGSSHQDVPAFEGNDAPTSMLEGAAADDAQLAMTEQVIDGNVESHSDVASFLQGLFGKVTMTIAAAGEAASSAAELAVAEYGRKTVVEGEEPLAERLATGSSFAIAALSKSDLDAVNDEMQQVAVNTSDETAAVELASNTPPPTAAATTTFIAPESSVVATPATEPSGGDEEPVTTVTEPEAPAEPADPTAGLGYEVTLAGGMYVLGEPDDSSSSASAPPPETGPTDVALTAMTSVVDPGLLAIA